MKNGHVPCLFCRRKQILIVKRQASGDEPEAWRFCFLKNEKERQMDFETFQKAFAQDVEEKMNERGHDVTVTVKEVDMPNGGYTALNVTEDGGIVGMNINLDERYQDFKDGSDYGIMTRIAADELEQGFDMLDRRELAAMSTDYSTVKDKLSLEVISTERNKELLENVPHEVIEDMSVVYRIRLSEKRDELESVLVTNSMLDNYGITAEQLKADALENAPKIFPVEVKGMSEVLADSMGMTPEEFQGGQPEIMFVASLENRVKGAGVLAYPNFLEDAAEKLGGDFYVLPSSVHEIILVKDEGQFSAKELEDMVLDVNASIVDPKDQLTDSAYHYDSKDHIFEKADRFEERQNEKIAQRNVEKIEARHTEKVSEKTSIHDKLKENKARVDKAKTKNPAQRTKGGDAR